MDPNFEVKSGKCKGNNEINMYGPFNITVSRWTGARASGAGGTTDDTRLKVCEFTFSLDNHYCRPEKCSLKYTPDMNKQARLDEFARTQSMCKLDCCDNPMQRVSRISKSSFDPTIQIAGHNCRAWYLQVLPIIQAVSSLETGTYIGAQQSQCHADSAMDACPSKKARRRV